MLSKTAQYALRAMVYITQQGDGRTVLAREVARGTGVPLHYLSRILREAVRRKLLDSTRGVGGGFRLARDPARIRLIDVLRPFDDDLGRTHCPFGQVRCNDEHPCGFHVFWKPVADKYWAMLEGTTLGEVQPAGLSLGRNGKR